MGTYTRGSKLSGRQLGSESSEPAAGNLLAGVTAAVVDDHARLDQHVQWLRDFCVALRRGPVPMTADPVALIEELECELVSHFAGEDLEEFFGSLVTDDPPLLDRVVRLQAEHGELAEALDHLMELAQCKPPSLALAEELELFLDMLEAHERAETVLMQELAQIDEAVERERIMG